jgi:3-hydroxyacyl-[acyl-carrier-protein] dehydratase
MTELAVEKPYIDIMRIMQLIPHRYPFLLVDRAMDVDLGKSIVGMKNVTINENFFNGHFPSEPVMPGVLIIEAMAQTSAILVVETLGKESEGKLVYFMSVEDAKFRKPVGPGDQIFFHVSVVKNRGNVWKCACEAKVNGQKVAEAVITAMILDR